MEYVVDWVNDAWRGEFISENMKDIAKIAEETDINNHRVMREQRHQKESKDQIRSLKNHINDLELEIDNIRRDHGKRRENISKKELALMEKAKKN